MDISTGRFDIDQYVSLDSEDDQQPPHGLTPGSLAQKNAADQAASIGVANPNAASRRPSQRSGSGFDGLSPTAFFGSALGRPPAGRTPYDSPASIPEIKIDSEETVEFRDPLRDSVVAGMISGAPYVDHDQFGQPQPQSNHYDGTIEVDIPSYQRRTPHGAHTPQGSISQSSLAPEEIYSDYGTPASELALSPYDSHSIGHTPIGTPIPFPSVLSANASPLALAPQDSFGLDRDFGTLDSLAAEIGAGSAAPELSLNDSALSDYLDQPAQKLSLGLPYDVNRERAYSDSYAFGDSALDDILSPTQNNYTRHTMPWASHSNSGTPTESPTDYHAAGTGSQSHTLQVPSHSFHANGGSDSPASPSGSSVFSQSPSGTPSPWSPGGDDTPTSPYLHPERTHDSFEGLYTRRPRSRSNTYEFGDDGHVKVANTGSSAGSISKRRSQKHPSLFACNLCDKKFTRAYNLRSHMRTHTDERPFMCTVCGKAFARQHDRKRHEDLHTGEKKFVCEGLLAEESWGCGRKFARADALGRHFRTEAGKNCIRPLVLEVIARRGDTDNVPEGIIYLDDDSSEPQLILQEDYGGSTSRRAVIAGALAEQIPFTDEDGEEVRAS